MLVAQTADTNQSVNAQVPPCRLPRDVRDKPVTSPLAQIPLRRLPRTGKFRGSRRNETWAKGDVTGLSRTCRGRHGEVGLVEFGHDELVVAQTADTNQCVNERPAHRGDLVRPPSVFHRRRRRRRRRPGSAQLSLIYVTNERLPDAAQSTAPSPLHGVQTKPPYNKTPLTRQNSIPDNLHAFYCGCRERKKTDQQFTMHFMCTAPQKISRYISCNLLMNTLSTSSGAHTAIFLSQSGYDAQNNRL